MADIESRITEFQMPDANEVTKVELGLRVPVTLSSPATVALNLVAKTIGISVTVRSGVLSVFAVPGSPAAKKLTQIISGAVLHVTHTPKNQ
ncbi:hypothetical protein KBD59_03235 [Candidatus Gracilibacteria bacterium]|nr:hypothetical protein [Candidatus Gracilibacteria bacterium]